jgi:hypothetical protein
LISFFKPAIRSPFWHEFPLKLPEIKPTNPNLLPPAVVTVSYASTFQRTTCPVGEKNVKAWTAAQRLKAEAGEVMASVDELKSRVSLQLFLFFFF